MDPNSDAYYQTRQDALMIGSSVLTGLAAIVVLLRCICRFYLVRMPGPDDYFLIAALVGVSGYLAGMFVAVNDHMGFPISHLTPQNMVNFLKTALAIQVIYTTTLACIKMSIVFTYLRLTVDTRLRYLCFGTITIHAVFFFISVIILIFQCQPVEKLWDVTGTVQGRCINNKAFFYSTSAFHILTDVWILILPIPMLKSVRRPRREKAALFCIFGVGALATASSCVRLHTIRIYTLSDDPFRDAVPVNLWTMIETSVAVICASVPGLKPIVSKSQHFKRRVADNQNIGASKMLSLQRRREQRRQQEQPGESTWEGTLASSLEDAPTEPVKPLPVATLGVGVAGADGNGTGHGPNAHNSPSDDESHLSPSERPQTGHSSERSIVGATRDGNMVDGRHSPV